MTRITCGRGKPHTSSGLATGARICLDLLGKDRAKPALVEPLEAFRGRSPRGSGATPRGRGRRRSALPRCRRGSPCRARRGWSGRSDCRRPSRQSWQTRRAGGRASSQGDAARSVVAVAAGDSRGHDLALARAGQRDRREIVGYGPCRGSRSSTRWSVPTRRSSQPVRRSAAASRSRAARAFTTSRASWGMRAAGVFGPCREGEDVRGDDIAILKQFQTVQCHLLGFRRKSGDQVGADRRVRPRRP